MYRGVCIELANGKRNNFMREKTPGEVKKIKEDSLWNVLYSNAFMDAFKKDFGSTGNQPTSRYVVIMRGFLSYWM